MNPTDLITVQVHSAILRHKIAELALAASHAVSTGLGVEIQQELNTAESYDRYSSDITLQNVRNDLYSLLRTHLY